MDNREEQIKYFADKVYYELLNKAKKFSDFLPVSNNKEKKRILRENECLKNKYRGERCFIVANGPSIKNENLGLLQNEYVFTVNQMIRKPEFVNLSPIANVWCDPAYFDVSMPKESISEFCELFRRTCNCNKKIINFVPLYTRNFMKTYGLSGDRVHFIDTSLYFYDNYLSDFDLTRRMPYFQNIVQYATAIAIYMGFKEIYLLGCDSTGIITKINSILKQSIEDCYTYDLGEKGQNYVNSLLDYFTVEEQFDGWARIFHLYSQLNRYCARKGIKYINCTSSTIIQDIPRIPLEEIIR
ncbi:hypothetical protein MOB1_25950 [Faecalimonas mobilis]